MDTKQKNDKTLETNGKITDELIAKYISGNTTEEEEDLIHDCLARNPEFANDLLDIATALKHQHKHDATIKKEEQEESKEAKRIKITPRRTFYAVAASIVILIGIGLLMFKHLAPSNNGEEFVLESFELCDTTFTFQQYNCDDLMSEEISTDNIFLCDVPDSLIYDGFSNSEIEGTPPQKTGFVTEHKPEALSLADNSASESQPQLDLVSLSPNSDASMMASLTVSEDDDNVLQKKDGVFTIDIPQTCNPENGIVLKWNCNAPSLKLELSSDGVTWKTLNNNIANQNSRTLNSNLLKDYELSNPVCFYWRMTAKYSDGNQMWQGEVKFSRENN